MQRTLERELKVPETAVGEAIGRSHTSRWSSSWVGLGPGVEIRVERLCRSVRCLAWLGGTLCQATSGDWPGCRMGVRGSMPLVCGFLLSDAAGDRS